MRSKAPGGGRRTSTQKDSVQISDTTTREIPPLIDQDEDNAADADKLDRLVPETSESNDKIQDSAATGSNDNLVGCAKKPFNRSPQDILNHDYTVTNLLDKEICIGCNEGGKVLVCSENGCPVIFHEKCMCCEPKFDTRGNYYCPYCWYKQAVMETQKLRKKAMMAKKSLVKFLDADVDTGGKLKQKDGRANSGEPKMSSLKGDGSCQDESNRHGVDGVSHQSAQIEGGPPKEKKSDEKTHGDNHRLVVGGEAHPSTSVTIAIDCNHYTEQEAAIGVELVQDFGMRDKSDRPKVSETHQSQSVEEKERIKAEDQGATDENVHETTIENPPEAGDFTSDHLGENSKMNGAGAALSEGTPESINVLEESQDRREYEEQMHLKAGKVPANANSGNEAVKSDAEDLPVWKRRFKQRSQRTTHPQNEDVTTSKMSGHSHLSPKQVRKPTLFNATRKRLNWTVEEENMLKPSVSIGHKNKSLKFNLTECNRSVPDNQQYQQVSFSFSVKQYQKVKPNEGVLKFSTENQCIPWKKILEFGCNVFDVIRTPVDLKDKWRNITAKEHPKAKRSRYLSSAQ